MLSDAKDALYCIIKRMKKKIIIKDELSIFDFTEVRNYLFLII